MVPPAIRGYGEGEDIYRRGQRQGCVPINNTRVSRFSALR
jgi:hypothetical protein